MVFCSTSTAAVGIGFIIAGNWRIKGYLRNSAALVLFNDHGIEYEASSIIMFNSE
jgi:hypothetical protein